MIEKAIRGGSAEEGLSKMWRRYVYEYHSDIEGSFVEQLRELMRLNSSGRKISHYFLYIDQSVTHSLAEILLL